MKSALLVIISSIVIVVQANAVTLTIRAEPEADLPGLLPSLRIWVTNEGSAPVEVPAKVALQVTPPRGEAFIAYSGLRGDDRVMLLANRPFTLAPKETRDLSFWTRDDWFYADARFRTVGTFRLQLVADLGLDSARMDQLSRVLDQEGLVEPLVSNEAVFTAVEPVGADLAVWSLAKRAAQVCTPEITAIIWEHYPQSRYAARCVRDYDRSDPIKKIAAYEAVLAKRPRPVWADGYRLNIANAWISRASASAAQDIEQAVEAYDRARALLEPLAERAAAPEHRKMAAEMLLSVDGRDEVVRSYNRARGIVDKTVRTGVVCFQQLPDGKYKVWFGHNNITSEPIKIPIGSENKFTPPPFDRKQPDTFPPGMFAVDFFVITKEPVLTWHLQKESARFKLNETVECPAWFDPNNPDTWTLDEP